MKVLYITQYSGVGGGESYIINLSKSVNETFNIEAIVVTKKYGELNKKLDRYNVENIVYDYGSIRKNIKDIIMLPYKLVKNFYFIKKIDPDIIHINSHNDLLLLIVPIYFLHKKVIWTCHGQWYKFNKLMQKLINKHVTKIIAVSNNVYNNLITNSINHNKIELIYLGVDTELFKFTKRKSKKSYNVGMIARFQYIKGHDIFVRMCKKILDIRSDIHFYICGGNPLESDDANSYRNQIVKYIDENKLMNGIFLLGHQEDIPRILSDFDILIVPSRNESFGMVIIEAMASGCPVIASKCDGPREIINHLEDGLLFEIENVDDLVDKFNLLIEDSNLRNNIIYNAYNKVAGKFSIKSMVDNTIKCYLDVK